MELIISHIKEELLSVDKEIEEVLFSTDNSLIKEVGEYIIDSPGKKIRPAVVLFIGKAFDNITKHHIRASAALELIHIATLLHDDVIDNSTIRHNRETINYKWGSDVSILVGDYIVTKAFNLALSTGNKRALELICRSTSLMCEGEITQIEKKEKNISSEDYIRIIAKKTAYLFSVCGEIGAIFSEANDSLVEEFTQFGYNLGIAFQITDDALDFTAQSSLWGKNIGNDLRQGKLTLPLIYAINNANYEDKQNILQHLNNGKDFGAITSIIKKYKGIERSLEIADEYNCRALENLNNISLDNQYIDYLRQLTNSIIDRVY